jgi:hypothetical protein
MQPSDLAAAGLYRLLVGTWAASVILALAQRPRVARHLSP